MKSMPMLFTSRTTLSVTAKPSTLPFNVSASLGAGSQSWIVLPAITRSEIGVDSVAYTVMPIAFWPRMSWITLSRSSRREPDPVIRMPEPSLTPRSLRMSRPRTVIQLRPSIRIMSSPTTPVPSRIGCSPGWAVSVIAPLVTSPLRGNASFSKYGAGASRTDTVSPATATSSASWMRVKSPPDGATV